MRTFLHKPSGAKGVIPSEFDETSLRSSSQGRQLLDLIEAGEVEQVDPDGNEPKNRAEAAKSGWVKAFLLPGFWSKPFGGDYKWKRLSN